MDRSPSLLIIYTGGTIGMKPTDDGLVPAKNYLKKQLEKLQQFHDKQYPSLTTPISRFGKRIHYDVLEWEDLLDSANMDTNHWIHMVNDIEDNYDKYDAFIIVHGTDTMAYTASALSFMLENLTKTIIITGSQVPIARDPNDAGQNLLGAITIAGHFEIPEVCIYFGNKLLRGNRTTKVDSLGFNAYKSPNFRELVKVGTEININWDLINSPASKSSIRVHRNFNMNVGVLKLFPGIHINILKNFLQPPLQGCVIETYGTGNAPNSTPEILDVFEEANTRGVVLVNVTQCLKGFVRGGTYATGTALSKRGVISGKDLTTEAALTKLSFLLGLKLTQEEVKEQMMLNLRGEITIPKQKIIYSYKEINFMERIAKRYSEDIKQSQYQDMIYPFLMYVACDQSNINFVTELIINGSDVNYNDSELKSPLHIASSKGDLELVKLLVENGAVIDCKDNQGRTPDRKSVV